MRSDNRTEKTIKKKRRRKKHYLLRFIIFLLICVGLYFISHIDYFTVDGIAVAGNEEVSDQEVLELSELRTGMNIFDVHPWFVERRIKKNLYIEDVDVDRKLPNEIVIHVTERSGKAQFKMGKKFVITDNDGMVLEISKEERQVTLVDNIQVNGAELEKTIEVEKSDAYEKTMAMIKAMENNDLYFKRINIDGNDVQAYVYDTLICKGKYDNVMSSIESDALRTVIYNLYQNSIESGVINISSNNYCSFTP